jgi:tetratricopeptide (TPR) repeat protein
MEPDALLEAAQRPGPRPCPICGVPYAAPQNEAGCPVCLLRQALQPQAAAEADPAEAGRFGHYELGRREGGAFDELGRGAMGVTFKAFDTVLHRPVALKVLDARVAADPKARQRFLREARAAARLRHPQVAAVFYHGVRPRDGQCFYAMELVEGETLEARLRRAGPLPVGEALEVVAQVACALRAAETQGLVHRDLKPSNLMLVNGPGLLVKVIDFGLAKAVAGAEETDLTHGGFVGTPAFASPEQFSGARVDGRSDLYALGVTLWAMLTGQTPFRGSPAEVKGQHLHAPLPLGRLKGVPQPAVRLLQTLLEKDPARRFQGAAQLLEALPTVTLAIQAQRTLSCCGLQKAPPAAAIRKRPARRGPEKLSLARLPVTGSHLYGREEDLAFLEAAWADPQVNVVSIVAWAGVGKSSLINHWLRRLAVQRYPSADFVFGWSFYRQGTGGEAASADEFLDAALAWFGDPDPRLGTAWEQGERLARLIAERRTLVVLDGLEPLQNPPGPQEGRLREPALQALLRELATFNTGLCVITTRLPVADLADQEGSSAPRRELTDLSSEPGAQLLQALGVKGPEAELCRASEEFGGHCLALTLLGSYLTDAYRGDIRCREEVSSHLTHDVRQGAHARKVMASYQSWFGEGPELAVLLLLGLFDRPADEKALGALLKPPAIPRLTESLTGLSPTEWRTLLARLRRARLLAGEDPHHPGQLDAHPLVREYFGDQLRGQRRGAWQEGNRRLYEHYRALAPPLPDSFRAMEPLFLAVICGCQAGLFRDALHEVYLPRIQRGNASFAANVLGARGALASVLAYFFEQGNLDSPVPTVGAEGQRLTAEDQLFILMETGLCLTATRGFAAPEAHLCYERAESLCHSLNRPLLLYVALMGRYRYSVATDRLAATMQIAERIHSLAQEQNNAALRIGACRVLASTHYWMGNFESAQHYAMRSIQLWRSGDVQFPAEEVIAPAVLCLCVEALSEWHLGRITCCQATMAEAISLAKELKHMHALAAALCFAGFLGHFERDPEQVERLASEAIELSTRHHFAFWQHAGEALRGWARSLSGDTAEAIAWIEHGIEKMRAAGWMLCQPYALALKAEALHFADRTAEALTAIEKAEALVERSEERWWSAELHRQRGVFLAAAGADEAQIEAAFREAIRTAKQQKSASLAARAEASFIEYVTGANRGAKVTDRGGTGRRDKA